MIATSASAQSIPRAGRSSPSGMARAPWPGYRTPGEDPARLDERLAGLFHDIGKRRTTTIKERTGEEQYIGHAGAGATLTREILRRLGDERALVERVSRWFARHMDLHMAARDGHSDRARRKLLGRIGDDLAVLQRLQLDDIASMAPEVASSKTQEALDYHRMLAATPDRPAPMGG